MKKKREKERTSRFASIFSISVLHNKIKTISNKKERESK